MRIPDWYRPNPGRAGELAFIFFGGPDDDPRPIRVTNGRFGLSAYGTATSATLNNSDTVYCINPIYHTSGLLTGIGGAVAGGSRLAMATDLDPTTFWTEVRRYGVTIVCYTWAQLRPLVNAAPQPAERNHSVRLFVGSGMPRGLWRRVLDRFAPAGVLDFWSTSEGEAILANVNPAKPGSLGRPLPGSATVEVVQWDPEAQQVISGADGYAIRCADDETGLGKWTEANFIQAIRTGRHQGQGRPILPPMPWPFIGKMTDDDLKAVFAFLKSIKPIANHVPDPLPPAK